MVAQIFSFYIIDMKHVKLPSIEKSSWGETPCLASVANYVHIFKIHREIISTSFIVPCSCSNRYSSKLGKTKMKTYSVQK